MSDPTFDDQFIEGDNTPVKKTNGRPKPVPRATKEALLLGKMTPREEIREVLSAEAEEAEAVAEHEEAAFELQGFIHEPGDLLDLYTKEDKAVIAMLSSDDEKIIAHALEILPHLGPEVTAAYLASVAGGQHAQHE